MEQLKKFNKKFKLIDNLFYVERAVNILLWAQSKIKEINPLDYVYNFLQTKFTLIKQITSEYEVIIKYIKNSSPNEKIINIFSVNRKKENENMKKWEKLKNHYLLFHETKIFNYLEIFSNGIKISPPEAPSTGYLFGKGIILLMNILNLLIIVILFIIKMIKNLILIYYFVNLL